MYRTFIVTFVFTLLGALTALPAAAQPTPPEEPPAGTAPPQEGPEPRDDAPAPEDWAGLWYTDFGFVELTVDGNEVTGAYSCCGGKIEGTVQGIRIEFSWEDPIYGDGWGYWYWEDRGTRLRGTFGKMEDFGTGGEWHAVRIPEPDLGDDPVRFGVHGEHPRHGTLRGEVALTGLEGDSIVGFLRGAYDLEARGEPSSTRCGTC